MENDNVPGKIQSSNSELKDRPITLLDENYLAPHVDRWARLGVTWPS